MPSACLDLFFFASKKELYCMGVLKAPVKLASVSQRLLRLTGKIPFLKKKTISAPQILQFISKCITTEH